MRVFVVGLSIAASACAGNLPVTPVSLSPGYEAAAQAAVRAVLKDPASATFGPATAARSQQSGTIRVCGIVNARNAFGGFSGPVRYVANLDDKSGTPTAIDATVGEPRQGGNFGIDVICGQFGL